MRDFLDDLPELEFGPAPKPKARPDGDCVAWRRVRCPACDSADCPVVDSHSKPVRWHVCKACGKRFKSIETNFQGT